MSATITVPFDNSVLVNILTALQSSLVRTNRTQMVEITLAVNRPAFVSAGLDVAGRVYKWFAIERCDGALNFELLQTDATLSSLFRASQGRAIRHNDFTDIYVSNPVSTGVCRFVVGWWQV